MLDHEAPLRLHSPVLRNVFRISVDRFSVREIAVELRMSPSAVGRCFKQIRSVWEEINRDARQSCREEEEKKSWVRSGSGS